MATQHVNQIPYQLGGDRLNHQQIRDWRNDRQNVQRVRLHVRNLIARTLLGEAYKRYAPKFIVVLNYLEKSLFFEATSKDEYENPVTLQRRLRTLLERLVNKPNNRRYPLPVQKVASVLGSSHGHQNSVTASVLASSHGHQNSVTASVLGRSRGHQNPVAASAFGRSHGYQNSVAASVLGRSHGHQNSVAREPLQDYSVGRSTYSTQPDTFNTNVNNQFDYGKRTAPGLVAHERLQDYCIDRGSQNPCQFDCNGILYAGESFSTGLLASTYDHSYAYSGSLEDIVRSCKRQKIDTCKVKDNAEENCPHFDVDDRILSKEEVGIDDVVEENSEAKFSFMPVKDNAEESYHHFDEGDRFLSKEEVEIDNVVEENSETDFSCARKEMVKDNAEESCPHFNVGDHILSEEEVGIDKVVEENSATDFRCARQEPVNEYTVSEAEHATERKSETAKARSASLIDFFTPEQIKTHIEILKRWTGQSASEAERGGREYLCQLCLSEKLYLAPTPLYCSSCNNSIKRDKNYYCTPDENGISCNICTGCFNFSHGRKITVQGKTMNKAELCRMMNDDKKEESYVQCDKCEGWQHQICALFNDEINLKEEAKYICPSCLLKDANNHVPMPLPKTAPSAAKDLPTTKLSNHIEERLFRRLKEEREERAKMAGKRVDEVAGAEDLFVRVVSSVKKQLKVKKMILDLLDNDKGSYPSELPYHSKAILAFQKIEGVDVCLFGMYVQEFGSDSTGPNQRCVYISFLDSVKYFRPEIRTVTGEALRTFVYHEILIGYLDFCKMRGFATCYLWACPPLKGEDYILYCHPKIQKTPKSNKLRNWYKSMLRKAVEEEIVTEHTNLYDRFFVCSGECNLKVTAARLPYFEGDYWSSNAESIITSFDKKVQEPLRKRTVHAMGHINPSPRTIKDILLMQKLGQNILPSKEDFVVAHLQFVCKRCDEVILSGKRWFCSQCPNFQLCERCHGANRKQGMNTHITKHGEQHLLSQAAVTYVPSDTKDEDEILDNDLLNDRHAFLNRCEEKSYQFDTLRRAKHTSMMILYHLRPRSYAQLSWVD